MTTAADVHAVALKRIDALLDIETASTDEREELERLVALVEWYERDLMVPPRRTDG